MSPDEDVALRPQTQTLWRRFGQSSSNSAQNKEEQHKGPVPVRQLGHKAQSPFVDAVSTAQGKSTAPTSLSRRTSASGSRQHALGSRQSSLPYTAATHQFGPGQQHSSTRQDSVKKAAFEADFPSLRDLTEPTTEPVPVTPSRESTYKPLLAVDRVATNWTSKLADAPIITAKTPQRGANTSSPSPFATHTQHTEQASNHKQTSPQALQRASSAQAWDSSTRIVTTPSTTAANTSAGGWAQPLSATAAGEATRPRLADTLSAAHSTSGQLPSASSIPDAEAFRAQLAVKQSKQLIPVIARKGGDKDAGGHANAPALLPGSKQVLLGTTTGGNSLVSGRISSPGTSERVSLPNNGGSGKLILKGPGASSSFAKPTGTQPAAAATVPAAQSGANNAAPAADGSNSVVTTARTASGMLSLRPRSVSSAGSKRVTTSPSPACTSPEEQQTSSPITHAAISTTTSHASNVQPSSPASNHANNDTELIPNGTATAVATPLSVPVIDSTSVACQPQDKQSEAAQIKEMHAMDANSDTQGFSPLARKTCQHAISIIQGPPTARGTSSPCSSSAWGVPAEEEAFLRSLGWTDGEDEDENESAALTEEEIAAFRAAAATAPQPNSRCATPHAASSPFLSRTTSPCPAMNFSHVFQTSTPLMVNLPNVSTGRKQQAMTTSYDRQTRSRDWVEGEDVDSGLIRIEPLFPGVSKGWFGGLAISTMVAPSLSSDGSHEGMRQ